MVVKAVNKEFCATSINSASSGSLVLMERIQNVRNPKCCDTFVSYFADKNLLFLHDLPPNFDTVEELEASSLPLDSTFDIFDWPSWAHVDRILRAFRPTTCLLDLCPLWLLKTSGKGMQVFLVDIINLLLKTGRPWLCCSWRSQCWSCGSSQLPPTFKYFISGKGNWDSGSWVQTGMETAFIALTVSLCRQLDQGSPELLVSLAQFTMIIWPYTLLLLGFVG